mgnify:CR=1 FL=1
MPTDKEGGDMELIDIVAWFGIPAAITGIGAWWIKRKVEANEKKQAERDTNNAYFSDDADFPCEQHWN